MNCPVDGTVLQMTERSGVEIDYCPRCRGVWLDRGELDKILERADRLGPAPAPAPPPSYPGDRDLDPRYDPRYQDDRYRDDRYRDDRYRDDRSPGYGTPHHKKKKGGFLGEIFDFD